MRLDRLYAYNRWANLRLLDAAASLPAERFAERVTSSFGSVRETFAHIVAVEWVWLQRCNGNGRVGAPEWMSEPTPAILREQLDAIFDGQRALIASADEERRVAYVNFAGHDREYALGEILFHVPNHSNYHRGQVVTLLRQLGVTPPPTDYVLFIDSQR